MSGWQLQEAKARLSDLVKRAQQEGPQEITVHGKPVAVVLSRAAFDRLAKVDVSLADFIRASPLHGCDELDLERDRGLSREVAL